MVGGSFRSLVNSSNESIHSLLLLFVVVEVLERERCVPSYFLLVDFRSTYNITPIYDTAYRVRGALGSASSLGCNKVVRLCSYLVVTSGASGRASRICLQPSQT